MSVRGVVALILVLGGRGGCRWRPGREGGGGRAVARRAYAEGKRHYDVGEYEPALAAFKRAYLAHEDPVLLYNIAQCQRQLHQPADALTSYRSYLRRLPDAANRAEVEDTIGKLELETGERKPPPPPEPPPPPPVVTPAVDPRSLLRTAAAEEDADLQEVVAMDDRRRCRGRRCGDGHRASASRARASTEPTLPERGGAHEVRAAIVLVLVAGCGQQTVDPARRSTGACPRDPDRQVGRRHVDRRRDVAPHRGGARQHADHHVKPNGKR